MTMQFKVEPAKWNPPKDRSKRRQSESRQALDAMQPGDVIRLIHPDLSCNDKSCSLYGMLTYKKNKDGWVTGMYHEEPFVAVIRRVK